MALSDSVQDDSVTITPATSIADVIVAMNQHQMRCFVVTMQQQVVGLLTEADVLWAIASQRPLETISVATVLTENESASHFFHSHTSVLQIALAYFQRDRRRLPLLDPQQGYMGLIHPESLFQPGELAELLQPYDAAQIQQNARVFVAADTPLLQVAQTLVAAQTDTAVIAQTQVSGDFQAIATVSISELIQQKAIATDFEQTPVQAIIPEEIPVIEPQQSLWDAYQWMQQHKSDRLLIRDDSTLEIRFIRQTDLLAPLDSVFLYKAISHLYQNLSQAMIALSQETAELQQLRHEQETNEAKLQALFTATSDVVMILDREGRYLKVTAKYPAKLSRPPDEFIGKTIAEVLPPDLAHACNTAIAQVLESQESSYLEYTLEIQRQKYWFGANITPLSADTVIFVIQDISDRKKSEIALYESSQRDRLLTQISQKVRQSLDLDIILETTVNEIQQLLGCDRVLVYRFNPTWDGRVMFEALNPPYPSLLNRDFSQRCFPVELCVRPYTKGRIHRLDSVQTTNLSPCYREMLQSIEVQANLSIPILQGNKLWGLLVAHHCSQPRPWQDWEVDLLQQLSNQVSIALQQSELYQQTQKTAQREKAIRRVVQAIHHSLNLDDIFATATREICELLHLDRAEIVRYFPERSIWINVASYRRDSSLAEALGLEIADAGNEFAAQLKQKQVVRVDNYGDQARDRENQRHAEVYAGAWLLVPLIVGEEVWGSLSLSHCQTPWQWHDSEVELTQTIATQLAIAIQQSQLYQKLQAANSELERLAMVDGLTEIANRRHFDEFLEQEWLRLSRSRQPMSLILSDIDYFKQYNDCYGHIAGDECLIQIARILSNAIKRPADLVARYGGEEFAIILPNTPLVGAVQVARSIKLAVNELSICHIGSYVSEIVTLSLGVAAIVPSSHCSSQILIDTADRALYEAKEKGRNTYCWHEC